ncbi:hypothetical protein J1614_011233 [Plenodomus biglobosus]|nr:hypothetical protein J1614_011233 [Plenodomus biglobosus]
MNTKTTTTSSLMIHLRCSPPWSKTSAISATPPYGAAQQLPEFGLISLPLSLLIEANILLNPTRHVMDSRITITGRSQ